MPGGKGALEEREQFGEGLEEVRPRRAERVSRHSVGSGGPAEAEVDASGVQGLQRAELLGDRQRGVVGQQQCPRSDPDRGGVRG